MGKVMNLTFDSSVSNLCEVNKSFDSGVIRIAYTGENRNKTYISKEAFEHAMPTIYNCPIVCNYDITTDELGGHDLEVVRDSEGELRVVNATDPIGVIPESAKVWFENYTDESGVEREYLYAEALFWKRQVAYQKLKKDGIVNQSMEIAVNKGKRTDGIYHIDDFEFTAFTAIGVEPCFESSAIEVFSQRAYKEQLTEMMNDLRASFSLVSTPSGDDNTHPQIVMKGDLETLEDKMELAAKYGIDVNSLDYSLEDFTVEELTEKFEAMKASESVNDSDAESAPQEETFAETKAEAEPAAEEAESEAEQAEEEAPAEEFALTRNMREEFQRELATHPVVDRWGEQRPYWFEDFDADKSEVYIQDPVDYLYYAFSYRFDNDKCIIDFNSKKRVLISFVDFVEGAEQSVDPAMVSMFEALDEKFAANESAESAYAELNEKYNALEATCKELREFKASVESAAAEQERNELFAKFEDLADVDAFKELQANADQYDLDTLEEKCFAIRGRQGVGLNFSLSENSASPKIKLDKKLNSSPKPYGGVVEHYLGEVD